MSRISFSTLACPDWSWTQTAEGAARYGYDGVEVRMVAGDTDLPARPEFAPGCRATSRRIFNDLGLQICGLASSVRFDDPDPITRAAQLDLGRRYVELAAELGAGFVRVFGDVLPEGITAQTEGQVLGPMAEGLNRLGEFARQTTTDVRIVLETHGDFSETRLLSRLFDRVVDPGVGILWDTHHPWRFHGESLDETARRVVTRTWHTHWKDSVTSSPATPRTRCGWTRGGGPGPCVDARASRRCVLCPVRHRRISGSRVSADTPDGRLHGVVQPRMGKGLASPPGRSRRSPPGISLHDAAVARGDLVLISAFPWTRCNTGGRFCAQRRSRSCPG